MPTRIRSLKPEWLTDEKLGRAGDAARVLGVGLILLADDYGRDRWSTALLAAEVWPYEMETKPRETLAKASRAMREVVAMGFVETYEVRGEGYYQIVNWQKHQRVDHPGKPRVPAPSRDIPETLARVSRDIPETLAPDQDQDQDQDLDQDQEAPRVSRSAPRRETAKPPATPPQSLIGRWFAEHWPDIRDPDALAKSLHDAFPALDLLEQAKRALAWEHANPERAKKRHAPFFQKWLTRSQDGSPGGRLALTPPTTSPIYHQRFPTEDT